MKDKEREDLFINKSLPVREALNKAKVFVCQFRRHLYSHQLFPTYWTKSIPVTYLGANS